MANTPEHPAGQPRLRFRLGSTTDVISVTQDRQPCLVCLDLNPRTEPPAKDYRRFMNGSISWFERIDDLRESSISGCPFCALVLKASQYLPSVTTAEDKVEINMHDGLFLRSTWGPTSEIVRIFPSSLAGWSYIGNGSHTGHICSKPGSKEGMDFVKATLEECMSSHVGCQNQEPTVPTRLLFIGAASSPIKIVLPNPNDRVRYAALSHCWGKPQKPRWRKSRELKLKRKNMAKLMREIDWNSLQPTYQDAITVCQTLNLKYLWIDSLCIIQDDRGDWAYEASRMADVYEDAVVVISASLSRNPEESFLSPRENWRCMSHVIAWDDTTKASPLLYARADSKLGRHRLPLYGQQYDPLEWRAWAFQEFRLAKRCINFTSDEIQWFCKEGQKCECTPTYEPWDPLQLSYSETYHWLENVKLYSHCLLTFSGDKLPALSGLAARFQSLHRDVDYIAGLWNNNHLPFQLGWKTNVTGHGIPKPGRPSKIYRAPTFSWASMDSRVSWCGASLIDRPRSFQYFVNILDAVCVPKSENPFGEISRGYIHVRGQMVSATLSLSGEEYELDSEWTTEDLPMFYPDTIIFAGMVSLPNGKKERTAQRSDTISYPKPFTASVFCLRLFSDIVSDWFMILGYSKHTPGAFERIGVLCLSTETVKLDGTPLQEAIIV
ncbi:hypothetical protein IFR05_005881 [Cadophora sp. M221]|nr:hypothetical protein IFR05_005881 [Cadophora sp. M221]